MGIILGHLGGFLAFWQQEVCARCSVQSRDTSEQASEGQKRRSRLAGRQAQ